MKKCTANMTAICRRLKRMRELKKLPLEEQRKKLKRVRPIKPYHKAKKGTAKKYAGILKIAHEAEANLIASRKKRDEEIYFAFGPGPHSDGVLYTHILDLHHRIDELQEILERVAYR